MSDDRLPAKLYIDAHLRHLNQRGTPYYIVNEGSYAGGTIMLKLFASKNECLVLQQQRDLDGNLGWMSYSGEDKMNEMDADDFIRRTVERDPDVWIIEIEDKGLENPFEGKVF